MKDKLLNKDNIFFICALAIVTICMFYWIGQKEGFHEDEIFSYGSSNYKYDNNFQPQGDRDAENTILEELVPEDNWIEKLKVYQKGIKDKPEETEEKIYWIVVLGKPIWKTSQDAREYLTIQSDEIFNFFSVYHNQDKDVHPPLFYYLVHIVSSFFINQFSKYIVFGINLAFFISTCFIIYRIFKLLNKEKLAPPTILLYGLSIGAISTVLFLRMYMMLTFFCLLYFYINLKIYNSDFKLNIKMSIQLILTTILGFLTQYYFCALIIGIFTLMVLEAFREKKVLKAFVYILCHEISAYIGIGLFIPSLDHIFNSYRGLGNEDIIDSAELFDMFINRLIYSFSLSSIVLIMVGIIILIYGMTKIINSIRLKKKSNRIDIFKIFLFSVPIIFYLKFISDMSPKLEIQSMHRYITPILPLISIDFVIVLDSILKDLLNVLKKKFSKKNKMIKSLSKNAGIIGIATIYCVVIIISVIGLIFNEPTYLYRGYNKYLEIAEEYKHLNHIYMTDNSFTHLSSLPEFLIYDKSMIFNIYHNKYENLTVDEDIINNNQFIITIKEWCNPEESLAKVMEATGCTNYQVLLDEPDDTQSIVYLISK